MQLQASVLFLSLALTITSFAGLHARSTIAGNGFFPQEESEPPQVSNQYLNDQDPDQEQQFRFPLRFDTEVNGDAKNALAPVVDEGSIAIEDTGESDKDEEDEPEIDTKFLANIDVNNLTPEQRSVYDELIELAKEEEEASTSQVQGRTFGLFKWKFHHLWNKFKSLFGGPKFLEFYSEPAEVVPVVPPHQYGHYLHGDGDDFKKRNELPGSPAVVQYQIENPLLRIPIIGDLTKFITRTIPKFYYDTFQLPHQYQQQQQQLATRRKFYNQYETLDQY